MTIFLFVIIGACILAVLHTYVLYPWWVVEKAETKELAQLIIRESDGRSDEIPGTIIRESDSRSDEIPGTIIRESDSRSDEIPGTIIRSSDVRRDSIPGTIIRESDRRSDEIPGTIIRSSDVRRDSIPGTQVQGEEPKSEAPWPAVYVLMAAHNEEAVLADKLASLASQDYPGPLRFLIGSDNSTDQTNDILRSRAAADARFLPTLFTSRQGKPAIINQLAAQAGEEGIYLITDASVMLQPSVITELVRSMVSDPSVGVVDTTMVQTGARAAGIGQPEEQYINREVAIKRAEGALWGAMIGPFGGCWALRAQAFQPVPDNFLVDDFFLCMAAYEQGYKGVSSPTAVVEEAVGQAIREEFRRKVRISSGNWQNLVRFRHLWWPFWQNPLAFAFFSHKVLRWWTPFLILIGFGATLTLIATLGQPNNYWVCLTLICVLGVLGLLVILDPLLSRFNVHFRPARFTRYFLAMNAALLVGFYRYLTGIKSNVWQPSQRH